MTPWCITYIKAKKCTYEQQCYIFYFTVANYRLVYYQKCLTRGTCNEEIWALLLASDDVLQALGALQQNKKSNKLSSLPKFLRIYSPLHP